MKLDASLEHGLYKVLRWSSSLNSMSKGISTVSVFYIECAGNPLSQTLSPDNGECIWGTLGKESISLLSLNPKRPSVFLGPVFILHFQSQKSVPSSSHNVSL